MQNRIVADLDDFLVQRNVAYTAATKHSQEFRQALFRVGAKHQVPAVNESEAPVRIRQALGVSFGYFSVGEKSSPLFHVARIDLQALALHAEGDELRNVMSLP